MSLVLEIAGTLLPFAIVCLIVVFVILRMKHKYEQGTLGKKEAKSAQSVLDSLIPLGMVFGLAAAILISLVSPFTLLSAIAWGPGIGMLFGYIAYEVYSRMEEGVQ